MRMLLHHPWIVILGKACQWERHVPGPRDRPALVTGHMPHTCTHHRCSNGEARLYGTLLYRAIGLSLIILNECKNRGSDNSSVADLARSGAAVRLRMSWASYLERTLC